MVEIFLVSRFRRGQLAVVRLFFTFSSTIPPTVIHKRLLLSFLWYFLELSSGWFYQTQLIHVFPCLFFLSFHWQSYQTTVTLPLTRNFFSETSQSLTSVFPGYPRCTQSSSFLLPWTHRGKLYCTSLQRSYSSIPEIRILIPFPVLTSLNASSALSNFTTLVINFFTLTLSEATRSTASL